MTQLQGRGGANLKIGECEIGLAEWYFLIIWWVLDTCFGKSKQDMSNVEGPRRCAARYSPLARLVSGLRPSRWGPSGWTNHTSSTRSCCKLRKMVGFTHTFCPGYLVISGWHIAYPMTEKWWKQYYFSISLKFWSRKLYVSNCLCLVDLSTHNSITLLLVIPGHYSVLSYYSCKTQVFVNCFCLPSIKQYIDLNTFHMIDNASEIAWHSYSRKAKALQAFTAPFTTYQRFQNNRA